jgi:alanine-glyoxylate transaminase/serine-glyoxylate transaminase/serine-pyruvate transaminase
MGISVTEPERGHIDKVLEVLTNSLTELGYKA